MHKDERNKITQLRANRRYNKRNNRRKFLTWKNLSSDQKGLVKLRKIKFFKKKKGGPIDFNLILMRFLNPRDKE